MPPTRGSILALTVVWAVLFWRALCTVADKLELLGWLLLAALGFYLLHLSCRCFAEPAPPRTRR